ncbi:ATP-binding protein [Streptomyces sp. NPDC051636]|uniref:ATP-binding protein n=1 Tax=Streptomyces sp. NPDC051636 TaxID=3365663 RepID=UPI003798A5D6
MPRSVSPSRRHAREVLTSWQVDPSVADTLVLVVSELVTNAVQHAAPPTAPHRTVTQRFFELALYALADHVRVEVRDKDRSLPVHAAASDYAEGGRGMEIVQCCTCRWGAYRVCTGGKVVWCDVGLDGSPCRSERPVPAARPGTPPHEDGDPTVSTWPGLSV